nr:hypothetical protein [Tanacetum cinerariifolium]
MSTQQDIYADGFKNRPPMLNKENYVLWSSRLLRYAKSRPNGKLIHNSIINGPYLKQIEADDQAIQTILLGLPEDIYAAVDSYKTAQEIWLRVQQIMKGFDIGIQEKKAKLFKEWERFTSTDGESIESYYHRFLKLMNDLKRNKHFPEMISSNLNFLNNLQLEWSRHVTIVHQTKDLHTTDYTQLYDFLKYNQKENVENLNGYNDVHNVENHVIQIAVQNPRIQNAGNQSGLIGVLGNANQNLNGNGNLVAARAKADLDEIEEVNSNCILMANLQQASTSGTQTDKAPVYDSDGSAEVHKYENSYDNEIFEIFTMFTQEEQYTELLEPILEPHQVSQNGNNVISKVSSVEQSGGTVEQHPVNVEKTRQLIQKIHMLSSKPDSFYHTEQKMALDYQNPFYLKQAQQKQHSLYDGKVLLEKHDPPVVHDSKETLQLAQERVDNTKTRRPQPRSNTKNDRVPSASKSSRSKNKEVEVEEHHRKLLLSRNKKHMSSECNNVKLATQNVKSKVVCANRLDRR